MFAVPGWSLGELKTQVEEPKSKKREDGTSKNRKSRERREKDRKRAREEQNGLKRKRPDDTRHSEDGTTKRIRRSGPQAESGRQTTVPHSESPQVKKHKKELAEPSENDRDKVKTKNKKRKQKLQDGKTTDGQIGIDGVEAANTQQPGTTNTSNSSTKPASKLTPLQTAMRQKLISARFRHLNQTLYTTPSSEASSLFASNPTFFDEYHEGFRQQVSSWPENPIDGFLQDLKSRGAQDIGGRSGGVKKGEEGSNANALRSLPRGKGLCTVADLGCGDAALGRLLKPDQKKLSIKVLSYDLQSPSPAVTKADIANLPLPNGSVNVAIFCLALMGTNWIDFVEEAWRILHWKGELWVAEIKSRFGTRRRQNVEHSVGHRRKAPSKAAVELDNADAHAQLRTEVDGVEGSKDQTDVSAFVEVLRRRGFAVQSTEGIDLRNKMFVKMRFVKALQPTMGKNVDHAASAAKSNGQGPQRRAANASDGAGWEDLDETTVLKPCLYKVR